MDKFDEYEHYRRKKKDVYRENSGESGENDRDDYEDISSGRPIDERVNSRNTDFSSYDIPLGGTADNSRKYYDNSFLENKKQGESNDYGGYPSGTYFAAGNNDFTPPRRYYNAEDSQYTDYGDINDMNSGSGRNDGNRNNNNYYASAKSRGDTDEIYYDPNSQRDRSLSKKDLKKAKKNAKSPKKKKMSKLKKVFIILLVLILILCGSGFFVLQYIAGGLNRRDINDDDDVLGVSDAINKKYGDQQIINFALFGIDTRDEESMKGLSDSIMIVSVNRKTGAVKMISILRDSYVSINGHGKQKITHAYSYGGPELAINTINQNFHMNIRDYATVNFAKMADIIDILGGIDLEITQFELTYTNGIGQSTYGKKNFENLPSAGKVHMNGKQAVSFARIRTDSDVKRAERQRKVLNLLAEKVKKTSVLKYPGLIKELLGYVETSMTYDEILSFAPMALKSITIEQTAVPDEEIDNPKGGTVNGMWVWRYDLDDASDRIHKFIYEDGGTDDSSAVQ